MHWLLSGPLKVEKITVKIAGLPKSLQDTRLVHLTDLHYDGLRLSEAMLAQAIDISNDVKPDLVLLTGDYVTDDPSPIHQLVRRLKYLEARTGVYAVLGNHDIYYQSSRTEITNAFSSIDINVLWNQIAYPLGKELPLVGLADYWSREFKPAPVMDQLNDSIPRIVLSHNPDTAKVLQKWRVDLQLSGHTHGGQFVIPGKGPAIIYYKKFSRLLPKKIRCWLPFLRPECAKVVRYWEWSEGFHKVGKNQLYVNRGLGTFPPGRLFCPPELTIITLANGDGR
ncbi:MAG: metallophosphoesterase [Mastigocoleus sp. MO_167.B18]|nr:metallophosphoesterase [Mastigocoleus sp. MO_167.B18]